MAPPPHAADGTFPPLLPEDILICLHRTDEKLAIVRALAPIATERGQSIAQMALAWVLRDGRVTSVIVGASSVRQLASNIEAGLNTSFTDDEMRAIGRALQAAILPRPSAMPG